MVRAMRHLNGSSIFHGTSRQAHSRRRALMYCIVTAFLGAHACVFAAAAVTRAILSHRTCLFVHRKCASEPEPCFLHVKDESSPRMLLLVLSTKLCLMNLTETSILFDIITCPSRFVVVYHETERSVRLLRESSI